MKKILSLLAVVMALGMSTVAMDAEAARRMGAGKSLGMQRQATPNKAPTAAPAQTPAANPATAAAAAPAAAPKRSWMGPLAGLAAGLGLAALASSLGFGGELASMLMMGLLAAGIMVAVGFFMRKRAAAKAGAGAVGGMQYAGAGAATNVSPAMPAYKVEMPGTSTGSSIGSAISSGISSGVVGSVPVRQAIPADFDVAGFVRNAKVNFIRLQAANDAGNLDDIRQFTTPEMFAQLKMDLTDRGAATQHTDVERIEGDVLEVAEEGNHYVVSVRFTGLIKAEGDAAAEAFDEVWHLTKPLQGAGGWVLSGIQQM